MAKLVLGPLPSLPPSLFEALVLGVEMAEGAAVALYAVRVANMKPFDVMVPFTMVILICSADAFNSFASKWPYLVALIAPY